MRTIFNLLESSLVTLNLVELLLLPKRVTRIPCRISSTLRVPNFRFNQIGLLCLQFFNSTVSRIEVLLLGK